MKEEAQYYKQKAEQSFAVGENESGEAGQQRQQQSAFRVTTTTATSGPEEDEKDFGEHAVRNIEFEFWLPFDALRLEMERLFRKDGTEAKIWIHGAINVTTRKVLDVGVGRLDNARQGMTLCRQ